MHGVAPPGTLRIQIPRAFVPLLAPARFKGAHGGRGSAKSHTFAEMLIARAMAQPRLRWACLREVQRDLGQSVKLLLEDKIRGHGLQQHFEIIKSEIRTPGGGLIIFRGMNDYSADSIKSLEDFDGALYEEAQTASQRSLELLIPTIRKPGSELWFPWNPRSADDPIDKLLRGPVPPPNSVVIEVNLSDNPFASDELRQQEIYDRAHNPVRHAHIWLGAYEPQAVGAIWSRAVIEDNRVGPERVDHPLLAGHNLPGAIGLARIVVAVDPATEADEGSNENGIMVIGHGTDGHAYLLEDASLVGTPAQWASRAVEVFDKWGADLIVAEKNQGGLMVRHTLDSIRAGLPIRLVWAARGKHVRAEPIAALYDARKVHHVGAFPEVESQMCLMTAAGYDGPGSPDRLDALVWGMTEVFPVMGQGQVYNMPLADFTVPPQELPAFWPRAYAMYVEGERVWALWCALDRTVDTLYVYTEHHRRQAEASVHASAIKARGVARGTIASLDGSPGVRLLYRGLGLKAQEPPKLDPEGAIAAVWGRISTSRLKVFSTCSEFATAYSLYRRDEAGRPIEEGRFMSCLADLVTTGARVAAVAGDKPVLTAMQGPADSRVGY